MNEFTNVPIRDIQPPDTDFIQVSPSEYARLLAIAEAAASMAVRLRANKKLKETAGKTNIGICCLFNEYDEIVLDAYRAAVGEE